MLCLLCFIFSDYSSIHRSVPPLDALTSQRECQPRGQCASVDDRGASSECKPLIYCSHNSHSLFSYSVDLVLELTMGICVYRR